MYPIGDFVNQNQNPETCKHSSRDSRVKSWQIRERAENVQLLHKEEDSSERNVEDDDIDDDFKLGRKLSW